MLGSLAEFTQNHIASFNSHPPRSPSPDFNQNYNGPKAEHFQSEDYIPMRKVSRENSSAREDYPMGSVFKIGTGLDNMDASELAKYAKLAEVQRQYKEIQRLYTRQQNRKDS